jgi:uncharacterized membrane protein
VHLQYDPPGGKLGNWLAASFGQSPADAIRLDLERLETQLAPRMAPARPRVAAAISA